MHRVPEKLVPPVPRKGGVSRKASPNQLKIKYHFGNILFQPEAKTRGTRKQQKIFGSPVMQYKDNDGKENTIQLYIVFIFIRYSYIFRVLYLEIIIKMLYSYTF